MKQLYPHWFHHEDENYRDFKIARQDVKFPSHEGEELNGEVTTYHISELNSK